MYFHLLISEYQKGQCLKLTWKYSSFCEDIRYILLGESILLILKPHRARQGRQGRDDNHNCPLDLCSLLSGHSKICSEMFMVSQLLAYEM